MSDCDAGIRIDGNRRVTKFPLINIDMPGTDDMGEVITTSGRHIDILKENVGKIVGFTFFHSSKEPYAANVLLYGMKPLTKLRPRRWKILIRLASDCISGRVPPSSPPRLRKAKPCRPIDVTELR